MKDYFRKITEYFYPLRFSDFDQTTIMQAKKCLLDYTGCAIFAAANKLTPKIISLIESLGNGKGSATVWNSRDKASPALAAFANAARTSNIEMDDCSSIGANAHPGVYVISAALAAAEGTNCDNTELLKSIIFGYDVVFRMGMMAAAKERELGLHGPGLVGGFGALASAGFISGLSIDELCNAFGITGSLLPLCPFISFIEGSDAKDFYGGWGTYLAMLAIEAAKKGITGPQSILDGVKSLNSLFCDSTGTDIHFGKPFLINAVTFKQFSACHSTHPAMNAIIEMRRQEPINNENIERVKIITYPYSYDLHCGVANKLNSSSARLSLSYTAAYCLIEGDLTPRAFFPENLENEKYLALSKRIVVEKNDAYGDNPTSPRGSIVEIHFKDGTCRKNEVLGAKWSSPPSDVELIQKFDFLSQSSMDENRRNRLKELIFCFEQRTLKEYFEYFQFPLNLSCA